MTPAERMNDILNQMSVLLAPRGYRKQHTRFERACEDGLQIIQLQSSSSTTADASKLTVNLAYYSRSIATAIGDTRKPTVWDAHWRERLGSLLPERTDKWWTVRTEAECRSAALEIVDGLVNFGLPSLDAISSNATLFSLWASGRSPGLTPVMRQRYLDCVSNITAAQLE